MKEGLGAAGLGVPCWDQVPGQPGSAGAAPDGLPSPPWVALAACGSLPRSPLRLSLAQPVTFRAGRAAGCAVTPACRLFLCRNGGILARACGLISSGVSAFNNLGVPLLLWVAQGFLRFRGAPGRCWDCAPGEAAGALPQPLPCSTLHEVQPCAAGSPARFTAVPWLLLARALPALFSLGQGVIS